MILRMIRFLLSAFVLVGIVASPVSARDRDPLAPIENMEAQQFEAFPPDSVSESNAEAIIALVNEARLFGVPLSVRVVSLPTDQKSLSSFDDLDTSSPIPVETVHEMARAWMEDEPIESSPGAEDGFLMFVVMPEDPTLSSAVIETGPNALPLNGITRANMDQVVNQLMMPRFANNEISQGVRTGLSIFSYYNLFGKPERIQIDELHEDLQSMAGIPLAGVTAVSAIALLGLAVWISRRPRPEGDDDAPARLSPFEAAALYEGRVNDAVVTGGLVHLIRSGMLISGSSTEPSLRIPLQLIHYPEDRFTATILDTLQRHADNAGIIDDAAARRVHDLMQPARSLLEDDLARKGLFNKDGRVESMWLLLASGLVGAVALFTLLPSVLGMASTGIFAVTFAALVIAGVLIWAARRSWTTAKGQTAYRLWSARAMFHDREIVDTIIHQDALISAQGGPIIPETVNRVRTLRGIGTT
jgi:uncharacterized protein (TIGR04222 family)